MSLLTRYINVVFFASTLLQGTALEELSLLLVCDSNEWLCQNPSVASHQETRVPFVHSIQVTNVTPPEREGLVNLAILEKQLKKYYSDGSYEKDLSEVCS